MANYPVKALALRYFRLIYTYKRSFLPVCSPRLLNLLPASLRQPRTNLSISCSPSSLSCTCSIGSIDLPLLSFITYSLFHSKLKTFLFCKAFLFFFTADSTDSPNCLPILLSISIFYFLVFLFSISFLSFVPCGRLS